MSQFGISRLFEFIIYIQYGRVFSVLVTLPICRHVDNLDVSECGYVHVCACVCASVRGSASVFVCVRPYVCESASMHVCECASVQMCECRSVRVSEFTCDGV